MALSQPNVAAVVGDGPMAELFLVVFVDGRKIRISNPDKGVRILQPANSTTAGTTTMRTPAALTTAIVRTASVGIGTTGVGHVVIGNDDDDGEPPSCCSLLFVVTMNKATSGRDHNDVTKQRQR